MADTQITVKLLEDIILKDFTYQPHSFVSIHVAFGTFGITNGDAAGFLAPVLQRAEAVVNG